MKRVLAALILLAVAFSAQANSVERRIRALVDDLAKKYMLTEESLVSKKPVTLVQVKNVSPLAEKNYVGQAVAERIKADAAVEYFVLPRLSLNAGLAYHLVFLLEPSEIDAYCPTTGDYYYSESYRAIDAFGLNPFQLPDGTPLTHDLYSANCE